MIAFGLALLMGLATVVALRDAKRAGARLNNPRDPNERSRR
jgi:hypothetical protein